MAGEHGKNMQLTQFIDVLERVMDEHKWPMQGHGIKYVRPHFDTRTGDFYGVSFESIRGVKNLFVVNEDRHRDLTAWIQEFLNSDPETVEWEEFS